MVVSWAFSTVEDSLHIVQADYFPKLGRYNEGLSFKEVNSVNVINCLSSSDFQ